MKTNLKLCITLIACIAINVESRTYGDQRVCLEEAYGTDLVDFQTKCDDLCFKTIAETCINFGISSAHWQPPLTDRTDCVKYAVEQNNYVKNSDFNDLKGKAISTSHGANLHGCYNAFANWFLIYRKDEYKNLKSNIDLQTNKLKKAKEITVSQDQKKSQEKKIAQIESQKKTYNNEMSTFRMKSNLLIALFMIITVSSFGSVFQGIVVAKLPFVPISFLTNLTHRGLMGDDYTECSYLFLYVISAYICRTNIQKIFGFEPPRSHMNPWEMTQPMGQ